MTAPPWPHHQAAPFPHVHNENVASDNSHVDQQIGAHYGDTTFHRYEIYNVNQEDPPERKHEVAVNHLEGGTARIAQQILGDLLRTGYATSSLSYHYALSVLSGRSLNEIDKSVFDAFRDACVTAERFPFDDWRMALEVVRQLMSCVWRQEDGGPTDAGGLEKVIDNFQALKPLRQAEITRHLDMILSGALQDRLDAVDAHRVQVDRLEPNRVGRAWKFFEAEPAPPRLFVPAPAPIESRTWWKTYLGGALVVLGMVFALTEGSDPVVAVFAILILIGGGYLTAVHGLERRLVAKRLERANLEHGLPYRPQAPVSPGHWVRTDFVREVHQRVDTQFREARPHTAGSWEGDTRGLREFLKARLVQLYGNAQVTPAAINWLIRWHAKHIGARWLSGTLFDYRTTLVPSARTQFLFGLGVVVTALGLIGLVGGGSFISALVIAAGGYHAAAGITDIAATRRHDREVVADNERLHAQEHRAYLDWRAILSDRPSDAEMARWLDLDKSYLKTAALRRCGLTNRDLVAHVVLTEGAAKALRARVIHGPARYSAYVVMVFLLTKSGVRQVEVDLNFLTGDVHDERRTSFRYDTLASARVSEVGVRFANDRRYIIGKNELNSQLNTEQVVRSRAFNLSLLNSEEITVVVESFEGFADQEEDSSRLFQIALDTSGISRALHILEAVAAEGRDWITQEHERRERRSADWREGNREPLFLTGDVVALFPGDTPRSNGDQPRV